MKDPWLASQEAAQSCCRACGGKLHRADDPRKAREVPHKLMEQWDRRYSFCCSTEGCRLRHTPVSVRFLGRKVYSEVFIVLISALMNGPNERRAGDSLGIRARFNRHRGHRVHREIPPYVTDEAAIASDGLLQIGKDCLCDLCDLCDL